MTKVSFRAEGCPNVEGRGEFVQVTAERVFFPFDPRPEEVHLEDIAETLSKICRFGGRTPGIFYSVAQHSVLVSRRVPLEHRLWGLLHDAEEYITGDMVKPIKINFPGFGALGKSIMRDAICPHFGLEPEEPECVKEADLRMVKTEKLQFYGTDPDWGRMAKPYDMVIIPMGWREARDLFLRRYYEITDVMPIAPGAAA